MPNLRSSIKRARQNRERRARNRVVRSRVHTFVDKAKAAIEEGDREASEEAVRAAISEIDRAVKKGVLHRNNGSRRKSRLMKHLNTL